MNATDLETKPATCERCKQRIAQEERRESYAIPHDGRWVHSACVGELCREVLALMAAVPDDVRLCDPE